ncbi:MAG TPA: CD1871A family CXXC motif-containing protein [Clostridia bacterium]|nr:CD1871A family CXXC motif-containing protein [Clostridia bacterium]
MFAAAFLLGAAFLVYGISRGEVAIVLKKAIYICLECIGIG